MVPVMLLLAAATATAAMASPRRIEIPTVTLSNGVEMPSLHFGTPSCGNNNRACVDGTATAVKLALSLGFNSIDTANHYRNQDGVARGIAASGIPRSAVWITSKVESCNNTFIALDNCTAGTRGRFDEDLEALQTEYVDLMLLHAPTATGPSVYPGPAFGEPSCNCRDAGACRAMQEQWAVMEEMYRANKTRSIGVSNFCPSCLDCLAKQGAGVLTPMVNQIMVHVGMGPDPQHLVAECQKRNITPQAYSPLGSGSAAVLKSNVTEAIAKAHGVSSAQVALRWLAQHNIPMITAASASQAAYMQEDLAIFNWTLASSELAALDGARFSADSPVKEMCVMQPGGGLQQGSSSGAGNTAGASAQTRWALQRLAVLDKPAGRYTQTRMAADGHATIVWNGELGLRISRCVDAVCSRLTSPITIAGTDPNPRFIRMELFNGSLPVMAYGAVNDTELHVTWCSDPTCTAPVTTLTATAANRVRHCDLALPEDGSDDAVVAVGISDPHSGSFLLLGRQSRSTGWVGTVVASSPVPFGVNRTSGMPTGGLEMPSLVRSASGAGIAWHVAYWDVVARSVKLALHTSTSTPKSAATVVVVAKAGPGVPAAASNPGAWPRMVQAVGAGNQGQLVLTYIDLPAGGLFVATCNEHTGQCSAPQRADSVGHRDVSDYGAGAFPELRAQGPGARGPQYVYFDDDTGDGKGLLKLLECSDVVCGSFSTSVLASGAEGFGRDCSFAAAPPLLFVSLLDLQGKDSPDAMVARLAVLKNGAV